MIGLYGVLSYLVTQQRREIGFRMALGAEPGHVLGMVVGRGLSLTAFDIGIGLAAWFGARAAASLLFDVSASDPITFVGVPILLMLTAGAGVLGAHPACDPHRSDDRPQGPLR